MARGRGTGEGIRQEGRLYKANSRALFVGRELVNEPMAMTCRRPSTEVTGRGWELGDSNKRPRRYLFFLFCGRVSFSAPRRTKLVCIVVLLPVCVRGGVGAGGRIWKRPERSANKTNTPVGREGEWWSLANRGRSALLLSGDGGGDV